eukprot:Skav220406  [mRNA]  locus=scaffold639:431286:433174:- [translate_table: standard]
MAFMVVDVQRWLIGDVTRLDLGRAEVTVEYEGRVKTVNLNAPDLHKYFRKCEPAALSFGTTPPAPVPATVPSTGVPAVGPTVAGAPGAGAPVLRREMTPLAPAPAPAPVPAPVPAAAPLYYPNYGPGYGLGIGNQPMAVPYAGPGVWRTPA